jgi:hypothetical protein
MTPGSYSTGDSYGKPLGMHLYEAYKNNDFEKLRQLVTEASIPNNRIIGKGLSTNSYATILK